MTHISNYRKQIITGLLILSVTIMAVLVLESSARVKKENLACCSNQLQMPPQTLNMSLLEIITLKFL